MSRRTGYGRTSRRIGDADAREAKPPARPMRSDDAPLRASPFVLAILGVTAAVVAVFGHPVPSVAAAVIMIALVSLMQGRSVDHAVATALRPVSRILGQLNETEPNDRDTQGMRGDSNKPTPPLAQN
jgi:hypothetical protein